MAVLVTKENQLFSQAGKAPFGEDSKLSARMRKEQRTAMVLHLGENTMQLMGGRSEYCHVGLTEVLGRNLMRLGVTRNAVDAVQFDSQVARQAMEDKARSDRVTMDQEQRKIYATSKEEAALVFRSE